MPTTVHWRLSAVQVDQLWEFLKLGDYPFPIEVRSYGGSDVERLALRGRVRDELRAARLLRGERLDADLEAALRLLVRAEAWLDSVWLPDEHADSPMRVLAARSGPAALLALQLPGESEHTGGDLILREIHPSGLVAAVVGELPAAPAGRRPPATAPASAFGGATRSTSDDTGGGVLISNSPRPSRSERDIAVFRDVLDAAHPRAGQIAANHRDATGRRRRSPVLHWFDNADDGRYLLIAETHRGEPEITLRPVDAHQLGTHVQAALNSVLPGIAG
ncbi:ESX secretion-associated protein EspG [Gandjariella thermophila]|uniref:ESX secretion-associated protein EspG n=1 Tax=Gandjariella thermophila TaxID=1931992 RepID=A0A4D4JHE0_9PSEU|nr:ESX secretion-associated protein EspG [Gandjariella thermophila]GDY34058.1 ESX secretion-associated protein EspG [Gandjariella thermophila]